MGKDAFVWGSRQLCWCSGREDWAARGGNPKGKNGNTWEGRVGASGGDGHLWSSLGVKTIMEILD